MFLLFVVLSYLVGSIPASFLLAKWQGIDLRQVGSHNVGATNLSRALGKGYGALGYLLDALKGAVPVFVAWHLTDLASWQVAVVGLTAIIGHIFPVFLGFKGGKGVATGSGVFIIINPVAIGAAFLVWAVAYFKTGYVSLGSLLAALTLTAAQVARNNPLGAEDWPFTAFAMLLTIIVLYTHRSNIVRLWRGTENKA